MLFMFLIIFGLVYIKTYDIVWNFIFVALFLFVFLSNFLGYHGVLNKFAFWVVFNGIASFISLAFYTLKYWHWVDKYFLTENVE